MTNNTNKMNESINYRQLFTSFLSIFCWLLLSKSLAALPSNSDYQILAKDVSEAIENNPAEQLLIEGIESYEAKSFHTAKNLWFKSRALYAQQADILGEALALNNIATARQQLGEWELAKKAIAQSLSLLEDHPTLSDKPGYWSILAKAHNTQGNNHSNEGKNELALASWQNASQYYLRAEDKAGIITTEINRAKA